MFSDYSVHATLMFSCFITKQWADREHAGLWSCGVSKFHNFTFFPLKMPKMYLPVTRL